MAQSPNDRIESFVVHRRTLQDVAGGQPRRSDGEDVARSECALPVIVAPRTRDGAPLGFGSTGDIRIIARMLCASQLWGYQLGHRGGVN